ncbi:MAG: glycosyltransferase [Chitinophagaceae bacterium]|nr:glycosyltransferase [Chitinophagaceae bacterium]
MAAIIISLALFIPYALLIIYYRKSWAAIPDFITNENHNHASKISIIITASNESANIIACINSILNQTYDKSLFEIIVVDDFSTDDTAALVQSYPDPNVKLISLKDYIPAGSINAYKKKAIETGIQNASGDLIVTTDADCIVPNTWLQTIATFYEKNNAAFIAMSVKYNCKNNFIEIFQALDFMTLQGITGASVYKKFNSMCNGANLAYSNKIFYEVDGFKGIDNIASGDDMLLMHKISQQYIDKILFLKNNAVIVSTQPMPTVKSFFNQRIRWASTADKYDDKRIIIVLMLVYFFNVLLFVLPLITLFNNTYFSLFTFHFSLFTFWGMLILSKTIVELIFLYPVAKFFNQQKLLWWFPIAQPFHIVYTVIAGWLGKFGSYKWKERKVK